MCDGRPLKVLQCPNNIAGQGWEYSQALRSGGHECTVLIYEKAFFKYPCDVCLDVNGFRYGWQKKKALVSNFVSSLFHYDIFHFHFGETLLPAYHLAGFGRTLLPDNVDLPLLKLLRKKMVMNYWGDDVRLYELTNRRNKFFPLTRRRNTDQDKVRRMRSIARFIDTAIVPSEELYEHVAPFFKRVEVIPFSVDVDSCAFNPAPSRGRNPLIVHSPTDRDVKGTKFIISAVEQLRRRYECRFQLLENLTHSATMKVMSEADIVVDQILLGSYGRVTVEGMASGKAVLCYVRDDLAIKEPEMPVVNATPENIGEQLESLIRSPERQRELGELGRAYVSRKFSHTVALEGLKKLYSSL